MKERGEIGRFSAAVIKRMIEKLAKLRPAPITSVISMPPVLQGGTPTAPTGNYVDLDEADQFDALAEKASPVDADLLLLEDSAASGAKKKVQMANVGITDHGALTGLADDDHAQYPLSAGRAGGQTIIGGTAGGDYLDLKGVAADTLKTRIGANAFGLVDASGNTIVAVTGVTSTETVFNEKGDDINYRFEGAADANLIKVDAGTDRVGIGVASPAEKLDINGNLALAEQGTIASGAAGKAKLIATDQDYLAYRDSDGRARNLSFAAQKRLMQCLANIGRTDFADVGFFTASTLNFAFMNIDDADGPLVQFQANNTGSSPAGLVSGEALTYRAWEPEFVARIKTGASVADVRIWIGLFSGDPMGGSSPAVHLAAFRFDTGAGDSNWTACTKDGSTLQTNDTGVAVAADTAYDLRIEYDGTNFYFWVNDAALILEASNLPGATTGLYVYAEVANLASFPPPADKYLSISRWALLHK